MCQCFSAIARYLLIAVNILTFIIGIVFVVIGSLLLNDRSWVSYLIGSQGNGTKEEVSGSVTNEEINSEVDAFFSLSGGLGLGVGLFMTLLSVLGFVGISRRSKGLLMAYVF